MGKAKISAKTTLAILMLGISVLFLGWIIFIDEHNIMSHYRDRQILEQKIGQREELERKIVADSTKVKELMDNRKDLEKFAREYSFMHRENEDVFVIVEEE